MSYRFIGSLAALVLSYLPLPAQTPESQKEPLPAGEASKVSAGSRPLVKKWTMMDLEGLLGAGLEGARHYEKGRTCFRQAGCFACHRFKEEGSMAGLDLTAVATRYGPSDLLAHILEPDREISQAYEQQEVTLKDGSTFRGLIMSRPGDRIIFQIDMTDPKATRAVDSQQIKSMATSKTSMMPSGLLDSFHESEILDLLAYLLSKGDPGDPMFK